MNEIANQIYRSYEDNREQPHRAHMGGSQIGNPCDRALFYQFRWAWHAKPPGRVLRLFGRGREEEPKVVNDLRSIGATVLPLDPSNGEQWYFWQHGGHFGLSLDGALKDLPGYEGWMAMEVKTAGKKSYNRLEKTDSVEKWNDQYWAQIHVGMHLSNLEQCLYVVICKDDDRMWTEVYEVDHALAERMLKKAGKIIYAEDPPEKISEDPGWYQCKFCDHWPVCHGNRVAEVNERTNIHATPMPDGTWSNDKGETSISVSDQRKAQASHLMRPDLVPYATAVNSDGKTFIEYDNGMTNHIDGAAAGRNCYTSQEMHESEKPLPLDSGAEDIRQKFAGKVGKNE